MRDMKYEPTYVSPRELSVLFPEGKRVLLRNIRIYEREKNDYREMIQEFRDGVVAIARRDSLSSFFVWFWGDAYLRHFHLPHIIWIDKQLSRLHWQLSFYLNPPAVAGAVTVKGDTEDWELLVRTAKGTPIADIALPYLSRVRHVGRRITALCPFHTEKSASFAIFTDSNTYHCFGCGRGGDVIDFVMKRDQLPFRDAVKKLV